MTFSGVIPERFEEAQNVRHCALSLVGEPIIYPEINRFLDLLHDEGVSSFLVSNAQVTLIPIPRHPNSNSQPWILQGSESQRFELKTFFTQKSRVSVQVLSRANTTFLHSTSIPKAKLKHRS
jgi:hypothetical protein